MRLRAASSPGSTHEKAERIETVLFDYGQVLSMPPDPATWVRMQAIAGLGDEQLHDAYWALRPAYDRGDLSGRTYWSAVASRTGTRLSKGQIEALLEADVELWAQPNEPMIAWAGRLRRAGVRTAILSNIGDAMAAGLTAQLPWLKDFERCVWSYELKLAKPEAEIFRRTAELLGVRAVRILFIDDKEENVRAARAEAMEAVEYKAQELFEGQMRERGFGWLLDAGE